MPSILSYSPPVEVVLTSEDEAAVDAFRRAAPRAWRVHYADASTRRAARLGDLATEARRRGIGGESLLNLHLALEARAVVCTTGSNWCRLINELRKARLDRACGGCTMFVDLCHGEW